MIEFDLIKKLKEICSSKKKIDRMHIKILSNDLSNQKSIKLSTQLNWELMHVEKLKKDFCKIFNGSYLDIDTSESEYNPSEFHKYKF